jgi:hypothetical protein
MAVIAWCDTIDPGSATPAGPATVGNNGSGTPQRLAARVIGAYTTIKWTYSFIYSEPGGLPFAWNDYGGGGGYPGNDAYAILTYPSYAVKGLMRLCALIDGSPSNMLYAAQDNANVAWYEGGSPGGGLREIGWHMPINNIVTPGTSPTVQGAKNDTGFSQYFLNPLGTEYSTVEYVFEWVPKIPGTPSPIYQVNGVYGAIMIMTRALALDGSDAGTLYITAIIDGVSMVGDNGSIVGRSNTLALSIDEDPSPDEPLDEDPPVAAPRVTWRQYKVTPVDPNFWTSFVLSHEVP